MPFEFGDLTTKTRKKEVSISRKNCLIEVQDLNTSYQVCFLLDSFYPAQIIKSFKKLIEMSIKSSYCILSATTLDIKSDDLKQVVDFYSRNSIDILNNLPPNFNNVIYVSIGRAIFSFTKSDDLTVDSFYDFIFNNTYFYSPDVKSYVFPIDQLYSLFKNTLGSFVPQDAARTHFAEFQLKTLATKAEALLRETQIPEYTIHKLLTKESIDKFISEYKDYSGKIALDIETSSLDFTSGKLGCITVCMDRNNTYFLLASEINEDKFNEFISNKIVIGQGFKFDHKFLKRGNFNILLPNSDTLILGQTLNESRSNSLKALAYYYTKFGGYDRELDIFKKRYKIKSYLDIPLEILIPYASVDALVTFIVEEEMQKQVDTLDLRFPPIEGEYTIRKFYEEIMMPSYREFFEIEYEGMFVKPERLNEVSNEIMKEISSLEEDILGRFKATKLSLDLNSPKQLGLFIEKNLDWKCYGRNKDDTYSTGEDQLVRWIKDGHIEAEKIKKLRSLSTLLGMFVGTSEDERGWREYIRRNPDGTYRIHPQFGIGNAASKRNTCKDPNLQQTPSHGEFSSEIKSVISVPPPRDGGRFLFGTLDYASLQIRLCALNSEDPFLCNLYKTDLDPDLHSTTGFELIRGSEYDFIRVKDNSREYEFLPNQLINVLREGESKSIPAKDLDINDEIL